MVVSEIEDTGDANARSMASVFQSFNAILMLG